MFPTEVSDRVWRISSSDKTLFLLTAKFGMQKLILKKVPRQRGFAQVSTEGKIPVLIDAHYTSRGEAYLDRSLYMLSVEFVLTDDEYEPRRCDSRGCCSSNDFHQINGYLAST